MTTKGWHRILTGWYRYTNAAGKELAQVERYRGRWRITVFPMADAARAVELRETCRTYAEAKSIAQREYRTRNKAALELNEKILRAHGHI